MGRVATPLFLTLVVFFLAKADDCPDGFRVETRTLQLGIDALDIVGDFGFFPFQPLDTRNEGAKLPDRDSLGFRGDILARRRNDFRRILLVILNIDCLDAPFASLHLLFVPRIEILVNLSHGVPPSQHEDASHPQRWPALSHLLFRDID